MRKNNSTRKVLRAITTRDSLDSKVKLGVLAEPYSGGSRISVSINGMSPQMATIPRALTNRAARSAGSPVTIRVRNGAQEIISWSDETPFFSYVNTAASQLVPNATDTIIGLTEDDVVADPLGLFDDASDSLVFPETWDGEWDIYLRILWEGNTTGYRKIWVYLDGEEVQGDKDITVDTSIWYQYVHYTGRITEDSAISFYAKQSSGSGLYITSKIIYARYIRG